MSERTLQSLTYTFFKAFQKLSHVNTDHCSYLFWEWVGKTVSTRKKTILLYVYDGVSGELTRLWWAHSTGYKGKQTQHWAQNQRIALSLCSCKFKQTHAHICIKDQAGKLLLTETYVTGVIAPTWSDHPLHAELSQILQMHPWLSEPLWIRKDAKTVIYCHKKRSSEVTIYWYAGASCPIVPW